MKMLFFFLLILVIHLCSSQVKRGIIVIPGLGRLDRLQIVVHNVNYLAPYLQDPTSNGWDCVVYIYLERSAINSDFWNQQDDLEFIKRFCEIIENPRKLVAENLRAVEPFFLESKYTYTFILLDDCKLPSSKLDFNLGKIITIMEYNKLTVASPLVIGANKGGGQTFRKIMQIPAPNPYEGHSSTFIEIFAWVTTVSAYRALWDLICPHVNPYAWGYDLWYDRYAKRRVKGHKMGIISTARVFHDQNFSAPSGGRTDSTDISIKWKAMKAQEAYYHKYLQIQLKSFRIFNKTWNGVATGFLYSPPNYSETVALKNNIN